MSVHIQSNKKLSTEFYPSKANMNLETRVKNVIDNYLLVGIEFINNTDSLTNDLSLDSLEKGKLFLDLEDEFDLIISSEEEDSISTVQQLIDFLDKKISKDL